MVAVVVATLTYVFISGLNDSGALVAAAISSGAIAPRAGLVLAAVSVSAGFFVFESAIASTIGRDLVSPSAITPGVLLVAIVSAIAWIVAASYFGLPSSSTHALLGGLVGAVSLTSGVHSFLLWGFLKVLLALILAPALGLGAGFAAMRLLQRLTRGANPRVNEIFVGLQPLNVVALALSYGANDGQKGVALISMALVATYPAVGFHVPLWVSVVCAAGLAVGIAAGGWRTMRTIGRRIYKLRPIHAFGAQTASALIVLSAALLGGPVSTPQVVSTSIIGVGSAERISAVRWGIARQIAVTWLLTIPASALCSVVLEVLATRIGL